MRNAPRQLARVRQLGHQLEDDHSATSCEEFGMVYRDPELSPWPRGSLKSQE